MDGVVDTLAQATVDNGTVIKSSIEAPVPINQQDQAMISEAPGKTSSVDDAPDDTAPSAASSRPSTLQGLKNKLDTKLASFRLTSSTCVDGGGSGGANLSGNRHGREYDRDARQSFGARPTHAQHTRPVSRSYKRHPCPSSPKLPNKPQSPSASHRHSNIVLTTKYWHSRAVGKKAVAAKNQSIVKG
ncbi:unnamed protein product [Sphagnum balticum]